MLDVGESLFPAFSLYEDRYDLTTFWPVPDVIAGVQFADGVKQQPDEVAA